MNSVEPRVSIVTPTYNQEAYIGTCIQSVLEQTYTNWEMVIVDDGSTDGTVAAVLAFQDPRIRLIRQENQGLAGLGRTYNRALAESRGEIVAILEGDDYWPKYKLDVQVPDFDDPVVVLSSGHTAIVDQDGNFMSITPFPAISDYASENRPVGIAARKMMDPESLTYTFPVSTMLRADALHRIGGFQQPDYLPLVDLPTFLRLTIEGEFRFHIDFCGFWRRHIKSTTKSQLSKILDGGYRHVFEFIRQYRDRLPLSDEEIDALELKWEHFQGQLAMLRGRMLAANGNYRQAAVAFSQGRIYRRSRFTEIAMLSGTALSRMHLPSEWMFRSFGRPPWRRLVNLSSGDELVSESDLDRPRPRYSWRTP